MHAPGPNLPCGDSSRQVCSRELSRQRLRDGVNLGPALGWRRHCLQSMRSRPTSASGGQADIAASSVRVPLVT